MAQQVAVHVPAYQGTASSGWRPPSAVEKHSGGWRSDQFLLSRSGFPPETAEDLELPVVDEHGVLHRSALVFARKNLRERRDIPLTTRSRAIDVVEALLETGFPSETYEAGGSEMTAAERRLRNLTKPPVVSEGTEAVAESRSPTDDSEPVDSDLDRPEHEQQP